MHERLIKELEKEFGELNEFEKDVIKQSGVRDELLVNQLSFATDFYVVKHFRQTIRELIESNKQVSATSDKYADALNSLTKILIGIAIIQVIVQVIVPIITTWLTNQ